MRKRTEKTPFMCIFIHHKQKKMNSIFYVFTAYFLNTIYIKFSSNKLAHTMHTFDTCGNINFMCLSCAKKERI